MRSFIDVIFQEPVKVGMVGPICSTATEPVAELAHFWNLVLVRRSLSLSFVSLFLVPFSFWQPCMSVYILVDCVS